MRVLLLSGARTSMPMGFGSAERQLVEQLCANRHGLRIQPLIVGGRAARRHARETSASWAPALPGRRPALGYRHASLAHLLALEFPPPRSLPYVLMVHDLAGLLYEDEQPLPPWASEALRGACRVLTPSRFTQSEVIRHYGLAPSRVTVIGSGLGLQTSPQTPPLAAAQLAELRIHEPYVLRLGGYTKRKNLALLLQAWPEIRSATGLSLVLAGAPIPARDETLRAAPSLEGVTVLDYVAPETIVKLLRSASILVSTSLYEGVGLSPLEAMSAGVPAVVVRSAAAEEMCGDATLYADDDPGDLAAKVAQVAGDDRLRRDLIARGLERVSGHSWRAVAERVHQVYRGCLQA